MKRPASHEEWVDNIMMGLRSPGKLGMTWDFDDVLSDFLASDNHGELFREMLMTDYQSKALFNLEILKERIYEYALKIAENCYEPPVSAEDCTRAVGIPDPRTY